MTGVAVEDDLRHAEARDVDPRDGPGIRPGPRLDRLPRLERPGEGTVEQDLRKLRLGEDQQALRREQQAQTEHRAHYQPGDREPPGGGSPYRGIRHGAHATLRR